MKKLQLPRTITIPKGSVMTGAPKMVFEEDHYRLLIEIGDDHTGYLILDQESIKALENVDPKVSIT